MDMQRILAAIVAAILLTTISCSLIRSTANANAGSANTNTPDPAQPEAASGKVTIDQEIRKVDFKNFTYEPSCAYDDNKKITVKNGEYSYEKPADGYTDRFYFKAFEISYGDLNGDNSEEAIVLTECNTGGTGNFTEGFIYTLKDGKPALFAKIPAATALTVDCGPPVSTTASLSWSQMTQARPAEPVVQSSFSRRAMTSAREN